MKTPSAPTASVIRRRTLPSAVASPRRSTFSCPAFRVFRGSLIHQIAFRLFTVFTFVSPSIHDFHARVFPPAHFSPVFLLLAPPAGMLTLPVQVPDLTLFNPFYPRPCASRSISFHQKSPVIPPIPLNSTYAVPPKRKRILPSQLRATANSEHYSSTSAKSAVNSSSSTREWKLDEQMLTFVSQVPATANSDHLSKIEIPLPLLAGIDLPRPAIKVTHQSGLR